MGQKAMHEYMGKQLGLNIKRQEAGIVSSEFTKTLEHNASQLALETDKFESNEQLAQAETLGIFTAEDGTEQNTLSREELMARLTGQFGVTTTRHRLVDGEQQSYQHTKMEDTVEMQKLKADLTGRFKDAKGVMQDTITKQQFEAAVRGYLQDKSPTFAREQFEEQKSINRNNALMNAGFVMAQKFEVDSEGNITSTDIYADPETGQPTTVAEGGQRLKTMEARRLELDELIAEAKINQNQTVPMPVLDAEGKQVYETLDDGTQGEPMMDTVTVNYLDRLRMNLDQQRLDHMMAMEATAMIGMDEAGNPTMDAQRLAIEQTRADTEASRVAVQSEDIAARKETELGRIGVEETRAQEGIMRAETSAAQEARALELQKAQIAQTESEGLSAQREGLGQFKGETVAENMKAQRQQYMTNLNDGLSKATAQDFEALEAAISTAMPPVPAGMVWDGNSGTLVFRRGYEGRDIGTETQRQIEQVQPVLRARDRAEKVLTNLQTHKFQIEMNNQTINNENNRIREALKSADIVEAEEAAYLKRNAETAAITLAAKNEKYDMLLQLMQSPVALGLAKHTGVLANIQADLGFEVSNVPSVDGDAAAVPTVNDWLTMTPEEQALKQALWVQETGGDLATFSQLIQESAPGAHQQLQYGVL